MAGKINLESYKTEAEAIAALKDCYPEMTAGKARKYIRDHLPKESYYQDKIIKHIKSLYPSAFVWKAAAGAYSRQGIPDVCAIIDGRFYGFEVKRPLIGVLSKIQEQTIEKINQRGGRAYVVSFPEEVAEILKEREQDVTKKYAAMIEAFECDFNLAAEPETERGLDDLQVKIEQGDARLTGDIDLLRELSFGIRNGTLKIIQQPKEGAGIEK